MRSFTGDDRFRAWNLSDLYSSLRERCGTDYVASDSTIALRAAAPKAGRAAARAATKRIASYRERRQSLTQKMRS